MDHYPEVNVQERSVPSSRHDSASSLKNRTQQSDNTNNQQQQQPIQYTSFPPPSDRTNSTTSNSSNGELRRIEAQYARYTDAPPQYTEEQYEGKSEDERQSMRVSDYAKEISRIMGRQLVRDMKVAQPKAGQKAEAKEGVN
ncbi:hypothetical protein NX059_006452 [Plenodomus lindquistii]|nr:hypothetical protein NX059_006452 [Plenodomus lindquistii]